MEDAMDIEQVPARISRGIAQGVEELRDRTADAVAADGGSVFREIGKVSRQVTKSESHLVDRVDDAQDVILDRLDVLIAGNRRTTWPRRLFWFAVGAAAGVLGAYLGDPDRGRSRRAQLSDQALARTRDVTEQVSGQAKVTADKARGAVIEQAKDVVPDAPEADAHLLEQRIRSEVLGHRDDTNQVVLRVDGPGKVALKGTVPSATAESELLAAVGQVRGVSDVSSELSIRPV
jgi:gas vesicle protein